MNPARYQELLGRLLEGELSGAEAEELAGGLGASPALRQDLRRHLVLWEVWSQHQAAERSAESFVNAWKTRLRAESESADAFPHAVRDRLQSPGMIGAWVRAFRAMIRRPAGIAWAASLTMAGLVALFWFAAPRSARAMTTIKGEAVCPACVLHESHEHSPAIRVTEGNVIRIYYLDRNAAVGGLQDYFCGGPTPVVAKGKARTEKGRRLFDAATVIIPDANKPKAQPTNDVNIIFPI
jgi:hypothetical protein